MPDLTIGAVQARPGQIVSGWFEALALPTGGTERLPVMIAQGREADGPVMWITTGIHGTEHTGVIAIHRLMTPELAAALRGTVIAIPSLNPAGLRTKERLAHYHQGDPNRAFPGPDHDRQQADGATRSGLEAIYARLFQAILASQPACLIDLHNAWIGSIPFAFRDPVFYHKGRRRRGLSRNEAYTLQARTGEALDVFGFTTVNEFAAGDYVSKNLHRSVSGSVLNAGGIPAFTVELGSWMHVDRHVVEACLAGCRNVMRHVGLLDGEMEPVNGVPVIRVAYPVRRHMGPAMPQAGIVHHLARPGELIEEGQPLARITDIFGQPIGGGDGVLVSEYDGFVLGWQHGVVHYQGDAIMALAIRDEGDLVVPYPD